MNHVITFDKVPDEVFNPALNEVLSRDWSKYENKAREKESKSLYFSTSRNIPLRMHKLDFVDPNPNVTNIELYNNTIDCADTRLMPYFPKVNELINWAIKAVNGIKLGKVMLVDLLPGGEVPSHCDPGNYFLAYKRFHIPLTTNSQCVFYGKKGSEAKHMPAGYISLLNNRNTHSAFNRSTDQNRIHLIMDIMTPNPKFNLGNDEYPDCQQLPEDADKFFYARPIYSSLEDFSLKKTVFPGDVAKTRFSGKYLIKYAWLTREDDPNWVDNYFKNGTELNINVRALTMHKLKPFWDDYERYYRDGHEYNVFLTRIKLRNYGAGTIDYISAWDAEKVDHWDQYYNFTQPITPDNFHEALEPFGFRMNFARFYIDSKTFLNFLKYCRDRHTNKDLLRFEARPKPELIEKLMRDK
jgi:hypothetical protein